MPGDRWRGEASEHVICAAEMGDVRAGNSLTSALTPHQDLPALGLGSRRVAGVTRGHLHYPETKHNWNLKLRLIYYIDCM